MAGKQKGQSAAQIEAMSALRLAQVEEALLAGRSHTWCVEHFSQPEFRASVDDEGNPVQVATGGWGLSPRQVQNYIARVEAEWRTRVASPERREDAIERCKLLMRRALDSDAKGVPGALASACKAADMLNKISGAYAPVEVKHSGVIDVRSMTPLQRRQKLAELEAKRAQGQASQGGAGRAH